MCSVTTLYLFFFFNDTATTEIYTLSLHDALPISVLRTRLKNSSAGKNTVPPQTKGRSSNQEDRKSTRLNSSHGYISYAVFCLKKKKINHCHYTSHVTIPLPLSYPSRTYTVHTHSS